MYIFISLFFSLPRKKGNNINIYANFVMNRFWSDEFVSPASLRAVAAAGSSSRGLREMREMRFMKCAL